jgi:hypothetical protein
MIEKIATAFIVVFFSGIIIVISIYGLKTWINLEAEEDKFLKIIRENSAIIFPIISIIILIIVGVISKYLFNYNLMDIFSSFF